MGKQSAIAAIARQIAAKKEKQPQPSAERIKPTPERERHNKLEPAGPAKRVVVPIRYLFDTDRLTPSQFDNLAYYRTQANQAQEDEKLSGSLDPEKMMGGSGGFAGSKIPASLMCDTSAIRETRRIEKELLAYGQEVLDLVRWVARDDRTLAQWCIHKHGGKERFRINKKGVREFTCLVPNNEKRVMRMALIDLKYAAGVIVR
jgi:hypothetical protein